VINDLFSNSDNVSMMRLCMFIVILTACGCAIIGVIDNRDLSGLGVLVSGMLGTAFIGKSIQKFSEKNKTK